MIGIMAHSALRSLLAAINSSPWFTLMADEIRDTSNREQLVICLRWVCESYKSFEDMIGLVQLQNTIAESVYMSLKDCLLHLGISFE